MATLDTPLFDPGPVPPPVAERSWTARFAELGKHGLDTGAFFDEAVVLHQARTGSIFHSSDSCARLAPRSTQRCMRVETAIAVTNGARCPQCSTAGPLGDIARWLSTAEQLVEDRQRVRRAHTDSDSWLTIDQLRAVTTSPAPAIRPGDGSALQTFHAATVATADQAIAHAAPIDRRRWERAAATWYAMPSSSRWYPSSGPPPLPRYTTNRARSAYDGSLWDGDEPHVARAALRSTGLAEAVRAGMTPDVAAPLLEELTAELDGLIDAEVDGPDHVIAMPAPQRPLEPRINWILAPAARIQPWTDHGDTLLVVPRVVASFIATFGPNLLREDPLPNGTTKRLVEQPTDLGALGTRDLTNVVTIAMRLWADGGTLSAFPDAWAAAHAIAGR